MDWKLDGTQEHGLYPIIPKTAAWYLDKSRVHPVLKIRRRQVPLAPAFAVTAHSSQGQTFHQGCIVDLCIGKGANPPSSYVGLTRVKTREDLIVYRPFPREVFCRGQRRGPLVLLRHLRGEHVDWQEIEAEYTPQRRCTNCNFTLFKTQYQVGQWNRQDQKSVCQDCVNQKKSEGTPYQCNICERWKAEHCFSPKSLHSKCLQTRVCTACIEKRLCKGACGLFLEEHDFTVVEWRHASEANPAKGKCKRCMTRNKQVRFCSQCKEYKRREQFASEHQWRSETDETRVCQGCHKGQVVGVWTCVACKKSKHKEQFADWLAGRKRQVKHRTSRCNTCVQDQQRDKRKIAIDSVRMVRRRTKDADAHG